MAIRAALCQAKLGFGAVGRHNGAMADKDEKTKRLAEQLRKNLRRRKGQARQQRADPPADRPENR